MSVSSQTRGSVVEQLVFCEHRIGELEDQNRELLGALKGLLAEYEDQRFQFGNDLIWQKYEDTAAVEDARRVIHEVGDEE